MKTFAILIVIAFATLISASANAEATSAGSTHLLFTLHGLDRLGLGTYEGGLGIRWFPWDRIAFRPVVDVRYAEDRIAGEEDRSDQVRRSWDVGFSLALERHFAMWRRLGSYAGVGAGFGYGEDTDDRSVPPDPPAGMNLRTEQRTLSTGMWGLFGIQWALSKAVHIGAEYELAYRYTKEENKLHQAELPPTIAPERTRQSLGIGTSSLFLSVSL